MAICYICQRNECNEGLLICASCYQSRIECMKGEDKIRREMRRENDRMIERIQQDKQASGSSQHASIHEQRGRKWARPASREGFDFLERQQKDDEDEDQ